MRRALFGNLYQVQGDSAVVQYMQQWTDPKFDVSRIVVTAEQLKTAYGNVDADLLEAIQTAIEQVKAYQAHILPKDPEPMKLGGAELGMRSTPVDSAGIYVPGGTAVLFSTMIMCVVPALVAGVPVENIAVVCPPPTRQAEQQDVGDVSDIVLATAYMLGLKKVYR